MKSPAVLFAAVLALTATAAAAADGTSNTIAFAERFAVCDLVRPARWEALESGGAGSIEVRVSRPPAGFLEALDRTARVPTVELVGGTPQGRRVVRLSGVRITVSDPGDGPGSRGSERTLRLDYRKIEVDGDPDRPVLTGTVPNPPPPESGPGSERVGTGSVGSAPSAGAPGMEPVPSYWVFGTELPGAAPEPGRFKVLSPGFRRRVASGGSGGHGEVVFEGDRCVAFSPGAPKILLRPATGGSTVVLEVESVRCPESSGEGAPRRSRVRYRHLEVRRDR